MSFSWPSLVRNVPLYLSLDYNEYVFQAVFNPAVLQHIVTTVPHI